MLNIKVFLAELTTHPGVYQMFDAAGNVLYVGKARNLKKRLTSYFLKNRDTKTQALVKHIHDIQVTITHSENEALLLECNLIKQYQPHYNILFRDDKSFPYILITKEKPYPCIDFYRGNKKENGHFFGPYPSAGAVRETIHLIQKLFGLRTCNDKYYVGRSRPCLQYQIGMCSGACAGLISEEAYAQDIQLAMLFLQGKNKEIIEKLNHQMELAAQALHYETAAKRRDQMAKLRGIQAKQYISRDQGDIDIIGYAERGMVCIQLLMVRAGRLLGSRAYFPTLPTNFTQEDVIQSFLTQHYLGVQQDNEALPKEIIVEVNLPDQLELANVLSEKAGKKIALVHAVRRGERKKWLEIANKSATQSVVSQILKKATMHSRFEALKTVLMLSIPPKRIECFDVSHTMGEETVASCVVFDTNGPIKSDYRRFIIKEVTPGDDIAAMHQVLHRRYKRLIAEQAKLPDIILIDGGLPQLKAASLLLEEFKLPGVILMGVAKGVTRKPGFETLHILDKPPIYLESDSIALHLIQQIRDEAHRFAITGHRLRRDKKRTTSILESIPGIGAKRRRELLRYFGGIQAINRASLDEIARVPGISHSLAQRIFSALHGVTV